jgi:uncharacterized protein YcbX
MAFEFQEVGAHVAGLELHALKGGAVTTGPDGQSIEELLLTPAAPEYMGVDDRGLVIGAVTDRDAHTACFVSRRGWAPGTEKIRYPGDAVLALAHTAILGEGLVQISLPGLGEVSVDLQEVAECAGETWDVAIHSGLLRCFDAGDEAADFVNEMLNSHNEPASLRSPVRDLRLFVRDQSADRLVRAEYRLPGFSHLVGGADGGAVLAANVKSLEALKGTPAQKDTCRVAANIWLEGLEPFAEDSIAALQIGEENAELAATNVCGRCVGTGASPQTGRQDRPNDNFLSMLAADRRGTSKVTGDSGAYFAVNFAPADTDNPPTVRKGDAVRIAWADRSAFVPRVGHS